METVALYIGYLIIWLIAVLLLGLSLCVMCSTILGLYRIIKYKHTFRLLKRYETRSIYKTSKAATQFLISIGISPEDTLKEAQNLIEKYRIRYKISED